MVVSCVKRAWLRRLVPSPSSPAEQGSANRTAPPTPGLCISFGFEHQSGEVLVREGVGGRDREGNGGFGEDGRDGGVDGFGGGEEVRGSEFDVCID